MADFDRLIAEASKRHIRVLLDMVMNHTSDQHKWFLESRSSRNNPYRDWYVWLDGKRDGNRQGIRQHAPATTTSTRNARRVWMTMIGVSMSAATVSIQVRERSAFELNLMGDP